MRATLIKLLIRGLFLATVLKVNNLVGAKPEPQPQSSPYFTTFDSFESADGGDGEYVSYVRPIRDDYRIRRLRRGFYYIDDGYITPVAASSVFAPGSSASSSSPSMIRRRQSNDGGNYYRPQHAKHKKLFVPNLYG